MKQKFKYLIIKEKPYNIGRTVAQINVSKLTVKESNAKVLELEKAFPLEKYVSCIVSSNQEKGEFIINNK